MRPSMAARSDIEWPKVAASTALVLLVLALTPFDVPSGWAAWSANGFVRVEDGAPDVLLRAFLLSFSWGTSAGRLLLAGAFSCLFFVLAAAGLFGARRYSVVSMVALTLALTSTLTSLDEGTRGLCGAAIMIVVMGATGHRTRATLAGLCAAAGLGPAIVGLGGAVISDERPGGVQPTPPEVAAYAVGLTAALLLRFAAFGQLGGAPLMASAFPPSWPFLLIASVAHLAVAGPNWRKHLPLLLSLLALGAAAIGLQGSYALRAFGSWLLCDLLGSALLALYARIDLRGRGVVASRSAMTMASIFGLGLWWAVFGAQLEQRATLEDRSAESLVGSELSCASQSWVLYADTRSYARHLGARAVGVVAPGVRHIPVYDPYAEGTDSDLLELRRSVYFTNTWPEDHVVSMARARPVYIATSSRVPSSIARYILPEARLWRVHTEPRGPTDRATALGEASSWFPKHTPNALYDCTQRADGSASDGCTSESTVSRASALPADELDELRARVVMLLRTGDHAAKFVALNELAQSSPQDPMLADLTRACQSPSPLAAADMSAQKFVPEQPLGTWQRRFSAP